MKADTYQMIEFPKIEKYASRNRVGVEELWISEGSVGENKREYIW